MNKNLTINMGNCNRRKYIPTLIDLVRSEEVEPMGILTQHEALGLAIDAYKALDERQEGSSRTHSNLSAANPLARQSVLSFAAPHRCRIITRLNCSGRRSEGCEPHGVARPTHSSTAQAESLNPHLLPLQTDPGAELRGQP
jgi:hypothetical protein